MDLSLKEVEGVKEYISSITKYTETKQEVFDHVLSCLEYDTRSYDLLLVNEIIERDFGGILGIRNQEEKLFAVLLISSIKKIFRCFDGQFFRRNIFFLISLIFISRFFYEMISNGQTLENINKANKILVCLVCLNYPLRKLYYYFKGYKASVFDNLKSTISLAVLIGVMALYYFFIDVRSVFSLPVYYKGVMALICYITSSFLIRFIFYNQTKKVIATK